MLRARIHQIVRLSIDPVRILLTAAPLLIITPSVLAQAVDRDEVLRHLNTHETINVSDRNKSYRVLFDAYLDLTEPPMEVGPRFNLTTIHPGMSDWGRVASWGEANPHMVEALLEAEQRIVLGLPYGEDAVSSTYRRAGLHAQIGNEESLRHISFPYLEAIDTISAFAIAEIYRLFEENKADRAIDLAVAQIFVLRQVCDREFVEEKLHAIKLLRDALSNLRDQFYLYRDQISAEQFRILAVREIPYLRADPVWLSMPENDRILAEAVLHEVFDHRGQPDRYTFATTFAEIQSRDEPLTRFGAYRRWAMIAELHGSLDASLERLTLIYDDWWRRWRVREYDPILDFETQFERTNPIRYAAVIASMQDLEELFDVRRQLVASINGTAIAAALCAYHRTFETYPRDHKMTYAQFLRRITDVDPYDRDFDSYRYRRLNSRHAIDTPNGRLWIASGSGILYSRGQNHRDSRANEHTDDGVEGDIVFWPPIRALSREQNLID